MELKDIKIQTSFDRRYGDDGRDWKHDPTLNDSVEKLIKCFTEYVYDKDTDVFMDEIFARHHLYCCASSPYDTVLFEYEHLTQLFQRCKAGDILSLWVLDEDNPRYIRFNCCDKDGLFPTNGAY